MRPRNTAARGVAAFAAAAGWIAGHPLPLVVALIIAGVQVLQRDPTATEPSH